MRWKIAQSAKTNWIKHESIFSYTVLYVDGPYAANAMQVSIHQDPTNLT